MSQFRSQPAPAIEPVVYPAACLAPVADDPVLPEPPPMPDPIERPAGEPSARTWDQWIAYEARRRERAELAGLYFQGKSDAYEQAYQISDEQLDQCVTFIRGVNQ